MKWRQMVSHATFNVPAAGLMKISDMEYDAV
jgi:hypothetical protein